MVLFFLHGAKPRSIASVLRLKSGVVLLLKKWCPETARPPGERAVAWKGEERLNCSATLGRSARRSG